MNRTDIRVALSAACVALVLAVAGCSAPAEAGDGAHGPAAEESESHGDAAEVVAFPVGFPVDALPMPAGELLHVGHPGDTWSALIGADDLVAALAEATQLLVDAGYTVTTQADGFAEFSHPDRIVRIIASVDGTYGSSLAYTLTDGALEAEDTAEHDTAPDGATR